MPGFIEPCLPTATDTAPSQRRTGCTRSSMTAIACRPIGERPRNAVHAGKGSTGPSASPSSPTRSPTLPAKLAHHRRRSRGADRGRRGELPHAGRRAEERRRRHAVLRLRPALSRRLRSARGAAGGAQGGAGRAPGREPATRPHPLQRPYRGRRRCGVQACQPPRASKASSPSRRRRPTARAG